MLRRINSPCVLGVAVQPKTLVQVWRRCMKFLILGAREIEYSLLVRLNLYFSLVRILIENCYRKEA